MTEAQKAAFIKMGQEAVYTAEWYLHMCYGGPKPIINNTMNEFNSMPDMDEPKPANDFESDWAADVLEDRVYLFNLYANHVYESLEDFCDRMFTKYGKDWINILKRK